MDGTIKIFYGNTERLELPSNIEGNVIYVSMDESIASVKNGIITGEALGDTMISYTYMLGDKAVTKEIEVNVIAGKHEVSVAELKMKAGEYKKVKAFSAKGVFDKVKYSVSNNEVAELEQKGTVAVIHALSQGKAIIYSKLDVGGKITVKKTSLIVHKAANLKPLPITNPLTGSGYKEEDDWNGSRVYFGSFMQEKGERGGLSPILWRVLEITDDTILLLSEKGLLCKNIVDSYKGFTWETCDLREWLNTEFLDIAFKKHEQEAILQSEVVNNPNKRRKVSGGNNTIDKVFLLSEREAVNPDYGFMPGRGNNSRTRQLKCTEYAIDNDGYAHAKNGNTCWWLRTPGCTEKYASYVFTMGKLTDWYYVGRRNDAVRPAIRVKRDSIYFVPPLSNGNPYSDYYGLAAKAPVL